MVFALEYCSVPPPKVMPAVPIALLEPRFRAPAFKLTAPEKFKPLPLSTTVPLPIWMTVPAPAVLLEIPPLAVNVSLRLKARVAPEAICVS